MMNRAGWVLSTSFVVATAVLGGCSASETPAPTQVSTPSPAPSIYAQFALRFQQLDNLYEACSAPSERCATGIATIDALTRDLKAAIAAHPDPAIYAAATDMLNSIDDTLQTFANVSCAIDAVPSVAELCAAQGGIFAVEMGVVENELEKAERIGG